MKKTNSQVRTMKKDITRIKGEEIPDSKSPSESNEPSNEPKNKIIGAFSSEDIKKIKMYKKSAKKDQEHLKAVSKKIEDALKEIDVNLRKHEKKEGEIDDRAFRKKRREILQQKRQWEKEKLKINKKLKKISEQLKKLNHFQNKLNNSPS